MGWVRHKINKNNRQTKNNSLLTKYKLPIKFDLWFNLDIYQKQTNNRQTKKQ